MNQAEASCNNSVLNFGRGSSRTMMDGSKLGDIFCKTTSRPQAKRLQQAPRAV